jgi:hypothetical protein
MKKGQITIISILMLVVVLIVYVTFLPIINNAINDSLPYLSNIPMAVTLVELIPLFMLIAIILSIFSWTNRGNGGMQQ